MGKNLIIEKTSSEEGRYAEVITKFFYDNYSELGGKNKKFSNINLSDTTKDITYQKIDCDFCDKDSEFRIETKNDTWIAGKKENYPNGTGNVPYEFATHVPKNIIDKIKTFISSKDTVTLAQVLEEFPELHNRYLGCNEKCEAKHIFLVGSEEELPENRRYLLKKIWTISNNEFKDYARNILIYKEKHPYTEWFRFTYQQEDNGYNAMVIIPIRNLIIRNVASEMPEFMFNNLLEKIPQLKEYHTSQEIENIILENK